MHNGITLSQAQDILQRAATNFESGGPLDIDLLDQVILIHSVIDFLGHVFDE